MEKTSFRDKPVTIFQLLMLIVPNILTILIWAIAITSDVKVTKSSIDTINLNIKEMKELVKEQNELLYEAKEQGAINAAEIQSLKRMYEHE
jgi:hypothetical protein